MRRAPHPNEPGQPLNGAPQMVEVSRDGKRVYCHQLALPPWDEQFYPDGIRGWMAKIDAGANGGMTLDPKFFLEVDEVPAAPGASRRRRRVVGLVLLLLRSSRWER